MFRLWDLIQDDYMCRGDDKKGVKMRSKEK